VCRVVSFYNAGVANRDRRFVFILLPNNSALQDIHNKLVAFATFVSSEDNKIEKVLFCNESNSAKTAKGCGTRLGRIYIGLPGTDGMIF
jgi:hypothetical protein